MAAPVATISEAVKSETFSAKVTVTGIFLLAVTDFSEELRDILDAFFEGDSLGPLNTAETSSSGLQLTKQKIVRNKINL